MKDDAGFPSDEQIDSFIDRLLPANEDMDSESASLILEREGVTRAGLASALKTRLEARISRMREKGEVVPPELLARRA